MRPPVQLVLSRAVFDDEFRAALKANPEVTLAEFDLTQQERELLKTEAGVRELMHVPAMVSPLPDMESQAPEVASAKIVPMAELGFAIRVTPYAIQHADGRLEVSADAVVERAVLPPIPERAPAGPLYGHNPKTTESQNAAEAVRQAAPEQRVEAVLQLINAIRSTDS